MTAGYFPGLGVELDAFEFLDSALGLFCVDIGGDDEHVRRPAEERAKAKAAAERARMIAERKANPPPDKVVRAKLELVEQKGTDIRCRLTLFNARGESIPGRYADHQSKVSLEQLPDLPEQWSGYAHINTDKYGFEFHVASTLLHAFQGDLYEKAMAGSIPAEISSVTYKIISQDRVDWTEVTCTLRVTLDPPVKTAPLVKRAKISKMKPTVPLLLEWVKADEEWLRDKAAGHLWEFALYGRHRQEMLDAIPELTKLLDSPDYSVRGKVASALGYFGPAARPAVPGLIRLLDDQRDYVRIGAIEALGKIGGPQAQAAVPRIRELSKTGSYSTRERAREALKALEPRDAATSGH